MKALDMQRRAIEERKRTELEALARLDVAFRLDRRDILGGLERLVLIADAILARAEEAIADGAEEAQAQAFAGVVEPHLRGTEGRARLGGGWEQRADEVVGFYVGQAEERIDEARSVWLNEVRRKFAEAEAMGWSVETLASYLRDDIGGKAGPDGFGYGRDFGRFRTAVREAVASVLGFVWTFTAQAAFASLEVRADLMREVA